MHFIKKKIDNKDIVCNIARLIVLYVRMIKEQKTEIRKVLSLIQILYITVYWDD